MIKLIREVLVEKAHFDIIVQDYKSFNSEGKVVTWWYEYFINETFKVKIISYEEFLDANLEEGYNPKDFYMTVSGTFIDSLILRKHCKIIKNSGS